MLSAQFITAPTGKAKEIRNLFPPAAPARLADIFLQKWATHKTQGEWRENKDETTLSAITGWFKRTIPRAVVINCYPTIATGSVVRMASLIQGAFRKLGTKTGSEILKILQSTKSTIKNIQISPEQRAFYQENGW